MSLAASDQEHLDADLKYFVVVCVTRCVRFGDVVSVGERAVIVRSGLFLSSGRLYR